MSIWIAIIVLVAAFAHYFWVDRRNSKLVAAYVDVEWSVLWNKFRAKGIESAMNDYFERLEDNTDQGSYKVIMQLWGRRYNVPIKYDDKDILVADSSKLAIMEAVRTASREPLMRYYQGLGS